MRLTHLMAIQYVSQSTGLHTSHHLGPLLGKGMFGFAFELHDDKNKPTGFVCKTVRIQAVESEKISERDSLRSTINEIHSLKTMGLLEGYTRKDDTFYIVMKKIEGNEPDINNEDLIHSSFNALRNCHRKNITHYDGHSGNFITNQKTGKTIAIDFGQSRDASFTNIIFDTWLFLLKNQLQDNSTLNTVKTTLKLFFVDYITYFRQNKLEAASNIIWWVGLIYGASYGIPVLMIPNHLFYDYLKSKVMFQLFLEVRSIGLLRWEFPAFFSKHVMNEIIFNKLLETSLFQNIMKPFYLVALKLPYLQLQNFYETNTQLVKSLWSAFIKNNIKDNATAIVETVTSAPASINYDSNKQLFENFYELLNKQNIAEALSSPTTNTCFQAALLYHPIKAGLTFINDAVINPLQPEFVAKARADLYFQHHPKLYAKAAANTLYNTTASCFNYLHPHKPAFS